jgi:hypothetical protein
MAAKSINQTYGFAISYNVQTGNREQGGRCSITRPDFQSDGADMQLNATTCSSVVPSWLLEVSKGYETDEMSKKLLSILSTGGQVDQFTYNNGIIKHKNRVWLGANCEVQTRVMTTLHDSATGGHSGFQ